LRISLGNSPPESGLSSELENMASSHRRDAVIVTLSASEVHLMRPGRDRESSKMWERKGRVRHSPSIHNGIGARAHGDCRKRVSPGSDLEPVNHAIAGERAFQNERLRAVNVAYLPTLADSKVFGSHSHCPEAPSGAGNPNFRLSNPCCSKHLHHFPTKSPFSLRNGARDHRL